MHSVKLYSALLAVGAAVASAQSTCTKDIQVTEPTPVISCDVVDANIIVNETVAGALSIEGPRQITKNLIVVNATKLISMSSTSIQSIGGNFTLQNLELLSSLNLQSLKSVNGISFIKLPQLGALTFGTQGVTKASAVTVVDTFLSDLSGLNLNNVDTLEITNNNKLTAFNSDLVNITNLLSISSNGNNMQINMTKLQTAAEIQLSNVKSFNVPSLSKVTGSLKFDTNPELTTFSAKNVTTIANSVTFINNNKLGNVSFPLLTTIGDLTIQNNTALDAIDGFPKLQTISGGVILRGNFNAVKLPSLKDVKGGVTVTSTTDISSFCAFFNDAKSKGNIQGKETCTSNNTAANEGGNGGSSSTSGGSGSGSGSGSSNSSGNAAAMLGMSSMALGVSVIAGMAQLW